MNIQATSTGDLAIVSFSGWRCHFQTCLKCTELTLTQRTTKYSSQYRENGFLMIASIRFDTTKHLCLLENQLSMIVGPCDSFFIDLCLLSLKVNVDQPPGHNLVELERTYFYIGVIIDPWWSWSSFSHLLLPTT